MILLRLALLPFIASASRFLVDVAPGLIG